MEWMTLPLKRALDFNGRSRRKEFWMWVLGIVVATIVLGMIDSLIGLGARAGADMTGAPGGLNYGASASVGGGLLTNLFALAIFVPNLAVGVRRLHDIGRTGRWVLLLVPFYLLSIATAAMALLGNVGAMIALLGISLFVMPFGLILAIVLLVFFCLEGTNGPNRYGPDPKTSDAAMPGQALG